MLTRITFLTVFAALLTAGALAQDKPPEVTLKTVTYKEFADTVRKLRGKVVVIDFWNDT